MKFLGAILTVLTISLCFASAPIDLKATKETVNLLKNLNSIAKKHALFGHQNAYREGKAHGGWEWTGPSDIFQISQDEPAMVGTDYREMDEWDQMAQRHREQMIKVYRRGGVLTMSWHAYNPVTKNSSHDKTNAVVHILPGGKLHEQFKQRLDRLANFALSLVGDRGELIPVIFRPYHEHNGSWFWWGKGNCTQEQYIQLWRFTVDYLRSKGVHNFLYAFSPNISIFPVTRFDFNYGFPGKNYVDIYGVDGYTDYIGAFYSEIKTVINRAKKDQKIAAITETGMESVKYTRYWTDSLLKFLKMPAYSGLAYVMLWRNSQGQNNHFYLPYPGHHSVPDFLKMKRNGFLLFQSNLPPMYR